MFMFQTVKRLEDGCSTLKQRTTSLRNMSDHLRSDNTNKQHDRNMTYLSTYHRYRSIPITRPPCTIRRTCNSNCNSLTDSRKQHPSFAISSLGCSCCGMRNVCGSQFGCATLCREGSSPALDTQAAWNWRHGIGLGQCEKSD